MPNSPFLTDSYQRSAPAAGLSLGGLASLRCPRRPWAKGGR